MNFRECIIKKIAQFYNLKYLMDSLCCLKGIDNENIKEVMNCPESDTVEWSEGVDGPKYHSLYGMYVF